MLSFVYMASCEGFIKVGVSSNLKSRISTMRTSNPFQVDLVGSFEVGCMLDARKVERSVHETLKSEAAHHRLEWFSGVTEAHVKEIIISAIGSCVKKSSELARSMREARQRRGPPVKRLLLLSMAENRIKIAATPIMTISEFITKNLPLFHISKLSEATGIPGGDLRSIKRTGNVQICHADIKKLALHLGAGKEKITGIQE